MEIESKSFTSSMPVNFPSTYKATMCADISIKTLLLYFSGQALDPGSNYNRFTSILKITSEYDN